MTSSAHRVMPQFVPPRAFFPSDTSPAESEAVPNDTVITQTWNIPPVFHLSRVRWLALSQRHHMFPVLFSHRVHTSSCVNSLSSQPPTPGILNLPFPIMTISGPSRQSDHHKSYTSVWRRSFSLSISRVLAGSLRRRTITLMTQTLTIGILREAKHQRRRGRCCQKSQTKDASYSIAVALDTLPNTEWITYTQDGRALEDRKVM